MSRSKKKKSSIRKEISKKYAMLVIIIILFLVAIIICGIINLNKTKKAQKDNTIYYTGNLYSANASANMIDYLNDSKNIVISPFNINTNLAILYNGADNNSGKELKSYFKKSSKDLNEEMQKKISSLNEAPESNDTYVKLYLSYIEELENKKYDELTISKISSLSSYEKEELQLLIKKINLTHEKINNLNELTENAIKDYKLSDKEKVYNEYTLNAMLEEILDSYETYKILNVVTNYHELYNNNIFKEKNIEKEYINNISIYDLNITQLDFTNSREATNIINTKFKNLTSDEKNRVVDEKDLQNNDFIMINTLDFNYEWETPFKNNGIVTKEFYSFDNKVSIVEMMYSNDKDIKYVENDYATGFIKYFKNNKYSFVGILPKKTDNFSLSTLNIDELLKNPKQESLLIGLPKFSYQYELDIPSLASNYNIHEIFSDKSNFTKASDEHFNLEKNVQKINITIGEKGTLQSNISKSNIENIVIEETKKEVILNRPFAFLIINNDTGDIIIIGKVIKL